MVTLICHDNEPTTNIPYIESSTTSWIPKPIKHMHAYIKLAGFMLSMVCLIFTFLTYALVPCLQNVHGKNLMCHVLSLMIGYAALFTITAPSEKLFQLSDLMCPLSGRQNVFFYFEKLDCRKTLSFSIIQNCLTNFPLGFLNPPFFNFQRKTFGSLDRVF